MSIRKITHTNTTALYFIALLVIIVAFLLLGGGAWVKELSHMHRMRMLDISNWNWVQILISLAIGFLLGLAVTKRR